MKFYKYLIVLSLFISLKSAGHPQAIDRSIDSLKYILKISEGIQKVDLLNRLAKFYSYTDKTKITPYAKSSLELAEKIKYSRGIGEALNNLSFGYYINNKTDSARYFAKRAYNFAEENNLQGEQAKALGVIGLLFWKKGNLNKAIEYFKKSLEFAESSGTKDVVAKAMHYLGLVYNIQGRYAEAIEYFLNSIKINEESGNKIEAAITLNNLAKVYNKLGNYEKAIKYSNTALKYANVLHDEYSLGRALNNLGRSYEGLKDYRKALEYLKRAKAIKIEIKDSVGLAYVLEDIAECYSVLGNYDSAEKYFKQILQIRKRIDSPFSQANSMLKLAEVYLKKGKYSKAKKYIDEAIKISPENNSEEILHSGYKLLSEYYGALGNYKLAFEYYKKYDAILHRIFNKEENKRIAELELKYEVDKKERENILLKQENKMKELKLDYQSYILNLIVAISILGLVLSFVLYRRVVANKKSNRLLTIKNLQIERANKELERKNKLILEHQEKLDKTLEVLKNEVRERKKYEQELIAAKNKAEEANRLKSEFLAGISHEIRTPVNTILSYVSLLKEDLSNNGTDEFIEYFDPIQNGANRLIRTIDSILNMSQFQAGEFEIFKEKFDLYSDVLVGLQKEFKPFAEKKNIELKLENSFDDTRIWGDQYTVTQLFTNLVDNAIKYTNEGFVKIAVTEKDDKYIYVSVEDSGIGIAEEFIPDLFEPFHQEEMGYSRAFDGNGLGLALVKKYVEVNKGKIHVTSEKGKGTKFVIALVLASVAQPQAVKN